MNNEVKETVGKKLLPKKVAVGVNKGGRPRKYVPKTGVTRETRVPITGTRDILGVEGKDPFYHYYWALDTSEEGTQIMRLQNAGYNFVQSSEVKVSNTSVYSAAGIGSIVRVAAGQGSFHYLMKIPQEWYEQDMADIERKNKEAEQSIKVSETEEGRYGSIKLGK